MQTWANSVKIQLVDAGYCFLKNADGDWVMMEGGQMVLSHRQQGPLLKLAAQQFGIE